MTDLPTAVVAFVTEPVRVPRPTLYLAVFTERTDFDDGSHEYESGHVSESEPTLVPGEMLVTIPGELEAQRAAKIEAAREAVIQAAKQTPQCVKDLAGTSLASLHPNDVCARHLEAALDTLSKLENETP